MILGCGIDIIEVKRIKKTYEKYKGRFLRKVLSDTELRELSSSIANCDHKMRNGKIIYFIAKRWALKEAISKAINCGFLNGSPILFRDIIIEHNVRNAPHVDMTEKMLSTIAKIYKLKIARSQTISLHVSVSDEANYVVANAILDISCCK